MTYNLILWSQMITIIFLVFALYYLLHQKMEGHQRYKIYALFGSVIYELGMVIEIVNRGVYEVCFIGKCVQSVGMTVFMIGYILFTAQYCSLEVKPYVVIIIIIVDTFTCYFHFNDYATHLFYKSVEFTMEGVYPNMIMQYNIFGWVFWFGTVAASWGVSIFLIVRSIITTEDKKFRNRYYVLLVESLVPAVLLIIYGFDVFGPFNPTMMVVSWEFGVLMFSAYRNDGLDMIAISSHITLGKLDAGVVILDKDNRVIFKNEKVLTMLPEDKVDSTNAEEHFLKKYFKIEDLVEREIVRDIEYEDNFYQAHLTPIIYGNSYMGLAILINDLTEQHNMLEELSRAKENADSANRVKTLFLSNISKEIKSPMNAIIGMSELIADDSRGRKIYDMANTIKKASLNLLSMVDNVLDYSELEAGHLQIDVNDYEIKELINECYDLTSVSASEKGLVLNTMVEPDLPYKLAGDSAKMRQILVNLISNSIKFTREGSIDLSVTGEKLPDGFINLCFKVADTGIGMSAEEMEYIFNKNYQLQAFDRKSENGTGLGLSIIKGISDLIGADIHVESTKEKGTTFSIFIKQQIVDSTPVSQIKISENKDYEQFEAKNTKVLICDDSKVSRMVLRGLLNPYKMMIDQAESALLAVEFAGRNNYDIILIDSQMAFDGEVSLLSEIREVTAAHNESPIVVAIAVAGDDGAEESFKAQGYDGLIKKPINRVELNDFLLKLIPESQRSFATEELPDHSAIDKMTDNTFEFDDIVIDTYMPDYDTYQKENGIEQEADMSNSNTPRRKGDITNLKYFDPNAAMALHNTSVEDYFELLELYEMEGTEKHGKIKQYFEAADWKNYEIFVHGLKSTSLSVGANELSAHAKEHEFAAKEGRIDYILNDCENLLLEYANVLDEAASLLGKGSKNTSGEKAEEISSAEVKNILNEALKLSEDFRSKEAAEKIEGLQKYKLDSYLEEQLDRVLKLFKMYDDDGAEELIAKLAENIA